MTDEPMPGGVTPIGGSLSERDLGADLTSVKFLTVAEVAALLRVSKMSVYRLIHSGELESVRFGRSFRVAQQAVDNYLRESFYRAG